MPYIFRQLSLTNKIDFIYTPNKKDYINKLIRLIL